MRNPVFTGACPAIVTPFDASGAVNYTALEKLIDHVWQNQQYVDENALSVTVKRLRDKIESSGERLIHTIYGIGYVFKG